MSAAAAFPWVRPRRSALPLRAPSTPHMAAAAVRIPDPRVAAHPVRFVSGGPQIFVHEGARQALERKLEIAFPGPVQLAVTDNRQRMITQTRARGRLRIRLHMMFLDAEERVQDALVEYIVSGDRDASQVVGSYIDGNSHRIRGSRPIRGPLCTRGDVHDLSELLERVQGTYFGGPPHDVLVTWGRQAPPAERPRRTIRLGSYSAEERLVRVHPILDRPWVPRYFVSYILYHELLHHVVPPVKVGGRTVLHPPEFLRRERQFRHFERAIAWEQAKIGRLLRA